MVNGSPTKTQMVDGASGKTQLAQLVAGGFVALVLIFLTGALAYMPSAVLAAVVLLIGLKLIDIKGMQGIARVRSGELVVALLTAATVVIVGIEQAIILAIVLSIIEHLYHAYKPHDTTLAVTPEGRLTSEPFSSGTVLQARPGLVIYRFGAGLYYANATRLQEEALWILENSNPKVEWFCLSGAAMPDVDYSGAPPSSRSSTRSGATAPVRHLPGRAGGRRPAEPVRPGGRGRWGLRLRRGRHRGIRQARHLVGSSSARSLTEQG